MDRKEFYSNREELSRELQKLNDDGFRAVYRSNRAEKVLQIIKDKRMEMCPVDCKLDNMIERIQNLMLILFNRRKAYAV